MRTPHEAIIDQETFDNVQRIRGNARRFPDGFGEAHPLTGLMYCADCGGKMYVSPHIQRQARPAVTLAASMGSILSALFALHSTVSRPKLF